MAALRHLLLGVLEYSPQARKDYSELSVKCVNCTYATHIFQVSIVPHHVAASATTCCVLQHHTLP